MEELKIADKLPKNLPNLSIEQAKKEFAGLTKKAFETDGIHRLCVDPVILNSEGKVLITQRALTKAKWPGAWCLPGGKFEPDVDEDIIDTLVRETKEELGLGILKVVKYLPIEWDAGEKDKIWRIVYFLVETRGEIQLEERELRAYKFISKEEIGQYFAKEECDPNSDRYRGELAVWDCLK